MTNLERYNRAFFQAMNLTAERLSDDLAYLRTKEWDSLSHFDMIANLEETFDIAISSVDVVRFNTYPKGKEILASYGVVIE
jgi:acyl carrier protein